MPFKPSSSEYRSSARLPLELPARVRWKGREGVEEAEGKTGNISGNGVFFIVSARLGPNTPITFSVQFPAEIAKASVELVGQGRIVRQSRPGEPSGVAAIIDDYQFVRLSAA
jgi:PilZ domain